MDARGAGASGTGNMQPAGSEPLGFVGRRRELRELDNLVTAASQGPAAVALIEGEAGIGKSRLLAEVVGAAEQHGFDVLSGRAHELERDRPFGTVADALGLRLDATDPEQAEIARFLYVDAPDPASPLLGQTPQLRFRLVEAIVARVERLASASPMVLAFEDLHWADPSTLLVIHHLSRRLRQLPIALLATLRPSPRGPELDRLIDELVRARATILPLGQLDAPEVAELVEQAVGAPPGPGLRAQVERAGGNPLFVTELVAALCQEGAIAITDDAAEVQPATLPRSLRTTILRRLSSLPEEALEALRIASVLGTSFSLDDLSVVLVTPSVELLSALREPLRTGLIGEAGEHLAFRHALVRDAIYADLPRSACRALHAQVARSLGAAGRASSEVARHFLLGAYPGDAEAVSWLLRAGRETVSRAPGMAVELYEAAMRLAGDSSAERDTLHAELGVALMWAGRLAAGAVRLRELLDRPHDRAIDASARLALAQALLLQGRAQA
ncbi:MAG: ATP-binding protein, partial [Pseudonocardiaceae bacterium]